MASKMVYQSREGIVQEMTQLSKPEEFLKMIQNRSKSFPLADAVIARGSTEILTRDVAAEILEASLAKVTSVTKRQLKPLSGSATACGLYSATITDVRVTGELRKRRNSLDQQQEDDEKDLVKLWRKMERETIESSGSVTYGENLDAPEGYRYNLRAFPQMIDPDMNDGVDVMPGINVPTMYAGLRCTVTPMHIEDGFLDSSNALTFGKDKLWLIVPDSAYSDLRYAVQKHVLDETKFDADKRKRAGYEDTCFNPLLHKNIFVSVDFLEENNIPFAIVRQRPGDIVYVKERVFHQVINLGKNLCEAVNVGHRDWMLIGKVFEDCRCIHTGSHSVTIPQKKVLSTKVIDSHFHSCPEDGCEALYTVYGSLVEHCEVMHGIYLNEKECDGCGKTFESKKVLQQHVEGCILREQMLECEFCGKKQYKRNLKRHQRAKHPNGNEDPEPVFQCVKCEKVFKNNAGLGSHKKLCRSK